MIPTMTAVPFGLDENNCVVTFPIVEANFLLGGIPGGGKSGGLAALLAGVMRIQNVAMLFIDPKKVEFAPLKDRGSAFVTNLNDAIDLLKLVLIELDRRTDELVRLRLKKFKTTDFNSDFPVLLIVIDELAALTSGGVTREEKAANDTFASLLRTCIALGRAVGISVITATQKPDVTVVPSGLRDLIAFRIAFKTTTADMTNVILGSGMSSLGGNAESIPFSQKGMCYLLSEANPLPVRAKAFWVSDDMLSEIVEHTKHLRVDLPWLGKFSTTPEVIKDVLDETNNIKDVSDETEFSF